MRKAGKPPKAKGCLLAYSLQPTASVASCPHSTFSIRHSAFDRCHKMTLAKKLYLQNEPI